MEVGIFGDYHSFCTGYEAMKLMWDITMHSENTKVVNDTIIKDNDEDDKGWERLLADKFELINFEVTPCSSNKDILDKLVLSLQSNKPKDLYIVQTTTWYMTRFGIVDHETFKYKTRHNITYNLPDARSFLGKRYQTATVPWYPDYVFNKIPFTPGGAEGDISTPRWIHQTDADFSIDQSGLFESCFSSCIDHIEIPALIEGLDDAHRMRAIYGELGKVLLHDHLGSQARQEEAFAEIILLNLLSQLYNVWYFHWFPPLGRVEDFNYMEDPHPTGNPIADFRRQNRKDTIGLNYAKLETKNTDKRIHPFSAMDWMIMTYRDKIHNELNWQTEEVHHLIFSEYISSNDTLMDILKKGKVNG